MVCQLSSSTLGVGLGEQVNVVTQNASTGTSTITVTGQMGSLVHTATVQVTIGSVQGSITPSSATLGTGAAQNFTVILTSQGGFTGDFNLSCSTDVGSVICSAPTTTLPANGSVNIPLKLAIASKANALPFVRLWDPRPLKFQVLLAAPLLLILLTILLQLKGFRLHRSALAVARVLVLIVVSLTLV